MLSIENYLNKTDTSITVRESTEYLSYGIPRESHLTEYRNVTEFRNLILRNSIILRNSESISVQLLEGDRHNPVTFVLRQHKKNSNVPDPTIFVSKTCFTSFKIYQKLLPNTIYELEITYLSWLAEIVIMQLHYHDPVIYKFKTQAKIHRILLAVQRAWIQDTRAILVSSS